MLALGYVFADLQKSGGEPGVALGQIPPGVAAYPVRLRAGKPLHRFALAAP